MCVLPVVTRPAEGRRQFSLHRLCLQIACLNARSNFLSGRTGLKF
ncbi:unknown protein [Azorhizobium caulinodans ORS 571]|uniref:Uncharacterized protein n=1 Tax=Azorhizobium caulinodans (strain ATCC 43989 / DSM 5975 / JCM 20966 / LMG 6465 / NBRC 14845 / NCIMB 13405 / ORS 571) TaxID=438753 RepID=A8HSG8_AZOC5|nr:unknown protein [Azorhizobium caulinodans ORS 571]